MREALVHKVLLELLGLQVQQVQMVLRVSLAYKDIQVSLVVRVHKVLQVSRGLLGLAVGLERKAIREYKAVQAYKAIQVYRDILE